MLTRLRVVVAVVHLEPGQTGVGHRLDHLVVDHPAASPGERVGHHRHPTCLHHEPHGVDRIGCVVGHVVLAAPRQQRREGPVSVGDDPSRYQCIGDVWAADGGAFGDLGLHVVPGQGDVCGQPLDDLPGPPLTAVSGQLNLVKQPSEARVVQIAEQVHADPGRRARDLHAGHQLHT